MSIGYTRHGMVFQSRWGAKKVVFEPSSGKDHTIIFVVQAALTIWMKLKSFDSTEFTASIIQAVNGMLLDMLAAVARKDYEDRRRRQLQGIEKAQADGKYAGRKPDLKKRASIASLLKAGQSYSSIQETLGCSRHLIADVKKGMDTFESA